MRYPIFALRISNESKAFLDEVKDEYGSAAGVNRFIDALCKFCLTGGSDVDGIDIRKFFEDALAGRLIEAGSRKARLRAADEEMYVRYAQFLNGEFGKLNIQPLICEFSTAAEFFVKFPSHIDVIQQNYLESEGYPLKYADIRRYTARWYQDFQDSGSADACLKKNIERRARGDD